MKIKANSRVLVLILSCIGAMNAEGMIVEDLDHPRSLALQQLCFGDFHLEHRNYEQALAWYSKAFCQWPHREIVELVVPQAVKVLPYFLATYRRLIAENSRASRTTFRLMPSNDTAGLSTLVGDLLPNATDTETAIVVVRGPQSQSRTHYLGFPAAYSQHRTLINLLRSGFSHAPLTISNTLGDYTAYDETFLQLRPRGINSPLKYVMRLCCPDGQTSAVLFRRLLFTFLQKLSCGAELNTATHSNEHDDRIDDPAAIQQASDTGRPGSSTPDAEQLDPVNPVALIDDWAGLKGTTLVRVSENFKISNDQFAGPFCYVLSGKKDHYKANLDKIKDDAKHNHLACVLVYDTHDKVKGGATFYQYMQFVPWSEAKLAAKNDTQTTKNADSKRPVAVEFKSKRKRKPKKKASESSAPSVVVPAKMAKDEVSAEEKAERKRRNKEEQARIDKEKQEKIAKKLEEKADALKERMAQQQRDKKNKQADRAKRQQEQKKRQEEQNIERLKASAASGNPKAQNILGRIYLEKAHAKLNETYPDLALNKMEVGVKYDGEVLQLLKQAFDCFTESAKKDYAPGICNYAIAYLYGYGVVRNPIVAKELFIKASALGSPEAANNLGSMAEFGTDSGDGIDLELAQTWYDIACLSGFAPAGIRLSVVKDKLKKLSKQ
ncbi:hypothetical protein FACS1894122_00500 [Alphaproteobacteria bacterium]|nr:hypothetical protein FACS1894122_00500 [Alphaproteobacteria bacterium]